MIADPLLSLFPAPLLRLILGGDDVIPAAWGPLDGTPHNRARALSAWHPDEGMAYCDGEAIPVLDADGLTLEAHDWQLPLAHWSPRLAQVTARLLGHVNIIAAAMSMETTATNQWVTLAAFDTVNAGPDEHVWETTTGDHYYLGMTVRCSPLPRLWTQHAPEVALLLAVWEATR